MKIKEGNIVRGRVTGIQPYGVFVELAEGCKGLIHISEITEGYVKDIYDFVHIGKQVEVKVLKFNPRSREAKLSLKDIPRRHYRQQRMKAADFETASGFSPLAKHLPLWIKEFLGKKES